jgi:hypothetical protein
VIAAKPNSGFAVIVGMVLCQAQMPEEDIFTPSGWVNARSMEARKQFLPYNPTPDETKRVLHVISDGCAIGTPSGPACDSITRVVLLSDKEGTGKAEPYPTRPGRRLGATDKRTHGKPRYRLHERVERFWAVCGGTSRKWAIVGARRPFRRDRRMRPSIWLTCCL